MSGWSQRSLWLYCLSRLKKALDTISLEKAQLLSFFEAGFHGWLLARTASSGYFRRAGSRAGEGLREEQAFYRIPLRVRSGTLAIEEEAGEILLAAPVAVIPSAPSVSCQKTFGE
jgi:hypothetical protein